jgi:hypothetical protein
VVQVLDVGLARPIRAGFAARLFDHYWDHPEEEEMRLPAQRKLCVKLISEAFEQDVSTELISEIAQKVGWVSLDGSDDNIPNISVAQTKVNFANCRLAGLEKAAQLKQGGTVTQWEQADQQKEVAKLVDSLVANRHPKRKEAGGAASKEATPKRQKRVQHEREREEEKPEDTSLEAEEPENEEAKQKEVFGFDIDKSLLVVGATIVFVFPPRENDVVPFRVADILSAAADELLLVQYRGFHQTSKHKYTPYNGKYRLVWDDGTADGKGERQANRKERGWSPCTERVDMDWVWGIVQLDANTLPREVQQQLKCLR